MTTAQAAKYQQGQQVELQVHDWTAPGHPLVWTLVTIESIEERDNGLIELVMVRNDNGSYARQIIGKRGGNKEVRTV